MKKLALLSIAAVVASGLTACSADKSSESQLWQPVESAVNSDPSVEQKVDDLLNRMTLEQKVAQVIQPEIRDITVEDMRQYGFGSFLNGGGAYPDNNKNAAIGDWIALAEAMREASVDDSLDGIDIPTMWGTDAVHGHNNVKGATIFPHNIGLGAADDAEMMEQIARVTALETRATGIDWIFAPTVAVAENPRWGRTYESYSLDPQLVKRYAAAVVRGMQEGDDGTRFTDNDVISTVKHFVGDGGTLGGDDQGNNVNSEEDLYNIHAQGYVGGLSAGAQSVMASFNSWHGKKIHGSHYLLTEVLKEKMGFDGFVVGDWNGHGQIKGCENHNCPDAMNAGLDVYMVPTDAWKPLFNNLVQQVQSGVIPESRLDDAVRRVLRVKFRAGLFERKQQPVMETAPEQSLIGHKDHRALAREAVRKSLVLLKNDGQVLPINPSRRILIAGGGADNIGQQSGGWSITWQGTGNTNADFPGGSSIYDGMARQVNAAGGSLILSEDGSYQQKPDVAIVVFGEQPYAEGNGDLDNLEFDRGVKQDLKLLKQLNADGIPVVSVFLSGRPMWVNPELNQSDAFVAAWLPGSEGEGVADVLLTDAQGQVQYDFTGKLSFPWPATPHQLNNTEESEPYLFELGYGLTYQDNKPVGDDLNESVGADQSLPDTMAIFDRSVQSPWTLHVGSATDRQQVSSSVVRTSVMTLETMDRRVQEDARTLTFTADEPGLMTLSSQFPSDWRSYQEAEGFFTMDIQVLNRGDGALEVAMACGNSCDRWLDLSDDVESQQWQTLSLPLQCLAVSEVREVFTAFSLKGQQGWKVNVSDINLTTSKPEQARVLDCPSNQSFDTLVWQEEFNGDALNMDRWSVEKNCWGGGNNEKQCYTDSSANLEVNDGLLLITARRESTTGTTLPVDAADYDPAETRTLPYSSARVRTKGKGDWQYGRVEVRAKLPEGQGVWPAIWMLPSDWTYGGWAASGEIDIMEAVNLNTPSDREGASEGERQRRVFGSLHFGGEWPDNTHLTNAYLFNSAQDPINAFQTYAVEWDKEEIRWYVNDTHYATIKADQWYSGEKTTQSLADTAPFDQPFHLLLNLAIGGKWPEESNDMGVNPEGFPKVMEVDYVRVYQ